MEEGGVPCGCSGGRGVSLGPSESGREEGQGAAGASLARLSLSCRWCCSEANRRPKSTEQSEGNITKLFVSMVS